MFTTDQEIEQELLNDWAILEEANHPEDLLQEWADGTVPIYYNDIISEWQEMPSSHTDTWQEYDINHDTTITKLMAIDLYHYYLSRYLEIYQEIKTKKEDQDND